jgi:hypothetical protein
MVEQIKEGMGRYYSEAIWQDPDIWVDPFNVWPRQMGGYVGESTPRIFVWGGNRYPYWEDAFMRNIQVSLNGEPLKRGRDYTGLIHNGFVCKRTVFHGCYQYGIHVPTFLSMHGFCKLYSREVFESERRRNERRQYARAIFGNLSERELQDVMEDSDLTVSAVGDTLVYNYKSHGGRVISRQKRRHS